MRFRVTLVLAILSLLPWVSMWTTPVHADLTITGVAAPSIAKAPNGSSKVNVLSFTVTSNTDTFKSIDLRNASTSIPFGINGITQLSIYLDNGDAQFDANTDSLVRSFTPINASDQSITFANSVSIVAGTTYRFYIVYDIANSVPIGATFNTQILKIRNDSAVEFTPFGTAANTFVVTGLLSEATSVAPPWVVQGQPLVPMAMVSVTPNGENFNSIVIGVHNDSANFVTTTGQTTGVTTAYLYQDDGDTLFVATRDTVLKSISGTEFTSASDVQFSNFYPPMTLTDGQIKRFFIVYDIGSNAVVSKDIKAQITQVSGLGTDSRFTASIAGATPIIPASTTVVGLSAKVTAIIPSNNFGPGSEVPMLKIVFTGNNASITINTMSIQNTGPVEYVTYYSATNGITKVDLYLDSNGDGEYEGAGFGDTAIGSQVLGYGNGRNQVVVTLNVGIDGGGLKVPTNNGTTLTETRTVFVVYTVGRTVVPTKMPSGDATSTASAELLAVVGSADITTSPIYLSGTLPLVPVPGAIVAIRDTSVGLRAAPTILSVTPLFQGQVQAPMIIADVRAEVNTPTASFQILNNRGTFYSHSQGISKVWLFVDENHNGQIDASDTLAAATDIFPSTTVATLPSFQLKPGYSTIIVAYDIGQTATTATDSAACQLYDVIRPTANVVSTPNGTPTASQTTLVSIFGGVLPQPIIAAIANVGPKSLQITTINATQSQINNTTPQFGVSIGVFNSGVTTLNIIDISPRFFQQDAAGTDISYEFAVSTTENRSPAIGPNKGVTLNFTVSPRTLLFQGTVLIDGFVKYYPTPNAIAVLGRYRSINTATTIAGASAPAFIQTTSTAKNYAWTLGKYIESITIQNGSTISPFLNGGAIPVNSDFLIQMKDSGTHLDESSIRILMNGIPVSNGTQASQLTTKYSYNRSTGLLTISNLGVASSTLQLAVNDMVGNPLPTSNIQFTVSESLKIENFLFYPSPLRRNNDLQMGFSVTQPSDVTVYLFSATGKVIKTWQQTIPQAGYQLFTLIPASEGLASGIYFAKLIAVDQLGNRTTATTKLAAF